MSFPPLALLTGLVVARVSDSLKARPSVLKGVLVGLILIEGISSVMYASCMAGWLPPLWSMSEKLRFAMGTFVVGSVCQCTYIPLLFDFAAEHCFGVASEGTVTMLLTVGLNFIALLGYSAPADSLFRWINWVAGLSSLTGVFAVYLFLPATCPKYQYDLKSRA